MKRKNEEIKRLNRNAGVDLLKLREAIDSQDTEKAYMFLDNLLDNSKKVREELAFNDRLEKLLNGEE